MSSSRGSALAGALVIAAGLLAGTAGVALGSSPATTVVSADFAYLCPFPSGDHVVEVHIAATLPATTAAGSRVQPTRVGIRATLPRQAVADLTHLGAASVAAAAVLGVSETGVRGPPAASAGRRPAVATPWRSRVRPAVQLPLAGGLPLAWPATAPAVTAGSGTLITFTAGALVLQLAPAKADGAPTTPARLPVPCALRRGVSGMLGAVPVTARASAAPPPQARSRHKPKFPKGCGKITTIGTGVATCGYVTGYSDVAKLYGAALLQPAGPAKPGIVNVDFAERHKLSNGKLVVDSTAELYYQGRHQLPPVTATFLAFRFVPVTATILLTEVTPIRIVSASGIKAPPYPITVTASTKISIRISRVSVNGVPLRVGAGCRTVRPVRLVLLGKGDNTIPPRGYTVSTGGPLTGMLTIPPFTGCGVSENLDPLLTGSISGSGNFVKLTQGKLCGPSQPKNWTCPPPVPKPLR